MMKFLREAVLEEANYEEILNEATGEKQLYLTGPMIQYDTPNHNQRIYPKNVIMNEYARFKKDVVQKNRALAELQHPDSMEINPDRVALRIVDLWEGANNSIWGKALVLDTPCGNTLRGIIKGGGAVGMSTRGAGSLKEVSEGIKQVQDDFKMVTIDCVLNPSAISAWVSPVMESKEFLFESGQFREIAPQKPRLDEKALLAQFTKLLKT